MLQEVRRSIADIARKEVGNRINADVVIPWIENDPSFSRLLFDFNKTVNRLNETSLSEVKPSHTNTRDLKMQMGTTPLPTLTELLRNCDRQRFIKTSLHMNTLMEEGEKPNPQEPYLSFHMTETDVYALVVGSVFHFYEEYLLQDENFSKQCKPEQIICALIETLSRDRNNDIYDAVANPQRLNWIDGYEMFSREFIYEWGEYQKIITESRRASESAETTEGLIARLILFDTKTARDLGIRYVIAEANVSVTAWMMAIMDEDEHEIEQLQQETINLRNILTAAHNGNYLPLKSYLIKCGKFQFKLASATGIDPDQKLKLQVLGRQFIKMANAL